MRARWLLALALFAACSHASACQRIIQITLTFSEGSADLDRTQIVRLAGWIGDANVMFARYTSAGVEAGATAKAPGRTPEEAAQLARMRAGNVALVLKTLFPAPLNVEKFAHGYREKKGSDVEVNDFAAIQLYPDLKTSKLPGCNPGLPDGLER
jgi:hypothetical protein